MKVVLAVLAGSSTEGGGGGPSGTGSACLEVTDPLEMQDFTISESL